MAISWHKLYKQKIADMDMVVYICSNCNYKFSAVKPVPPRNCPYCGAKGSVEPEASASQILREVEGLVQEDRI